MGIVIPKLRASARGQTCTVQIPGVCNRDSATTVLAHLPSEVKAMGTKSDDWNACFSCSSCHEYLDTYKLTADEALHYMFRALQRTQKIWFEEGLMQFPSHTPQRKHVSKIVPRRHIGNGERI